MSELVSDCPRCGATHTTFDVLASHAIGKDHIKRRTMSEAFGVCRNCKGGTIFQVVQRRDGIDSDQLARKGLHQVAGSLSGVVEILTFVNVSHRVSTNPPEHLPPEIEAAFREAASCAAIGCFNAAGAMYRLCVDHATWALLPEGNVDGLNATIRRSLGHRLAWLFDKGLVTKDLRELSDAIKEDGNDGAHEGNLSADDAEDLKDFTVALLERLYTEPERLRLAQERRRGRRQDSPSPPPS